MFKNIFTVWKRDDLLKQALSKTETMFQLAAKNFDNATEELVNTLNKGQATIYMTDQKINECEKEVRRKVLEHLSINPKQDLGSSLILITVVKDLERIGDYVKNIAELAHRHPRKLPRNVYTKELIEIRNRMSVILKDSLKVFKQADVKKAKEYYKFYREVTEKADTMIEIIMEEKEMKVRDAVMSALFSRYLKRIAAHLGNILTTIINPFHLVGYGFDDFKDEEIK